MIMSITNCGECPEFADDQCPLHERVSASGVPCVLGKRLAVAEANNMLLRIELSKANGVIGDMTTHVPYLEGRVEALEATVAAVTALARHARETSDSCTAWSIVSELIKRSEPTR